MGEINRIYPVADLHCDLLSYLSAVENASHLNSREIGCSLPYLLEGNVKFQVMAIYTTVEKNSPIQLLRQSEIYNQLINNNSDKLINLTGYKEIKQVLNSNKIGIMLSIENASGLCNEDEPLKLAFTRYDYLESKLKSIVYISFTHHGENRFGGGNYTKIGLKEDGKELLNYLSGKKIAIDLSHASDALAHDIINHIDRQKLSLPIIASHSNYRSVREHTRNLPDEIAAEIVRKKGLIGINFVRAFVHPDNPNMLIEHILYGFQSGASKCICFGADFFCTKSHPDPSRHPFFFKEHENAAKYQEILSSLNNILSEEEISALAFNNFADFANRLYRR